MGCAESPAGPAPRAAVLSVGSVLIATGGFEAASSLLGLCEHLEASKRARAATSTAAEHGLLKFSLLYFLFFFFFGFGLICVGIAFNERAHPAALEVNAEPPRLHPTP